MCGILGAVFVNDPQALDLKAALASLHHRGPDDQGTFFAPGVALGHTRLAVIDLSPAGHQPMSSADGQVTVVFNGEIYNHHELRRELEVKGHHFRSRSDTEVIVEGYRAFGDQVIDKIDGMFALAILDQPRRHLLLARDRAGKKPLFYCQMGRGLWFASEIKALLALGLEPKINNSAIPFMLTMGYTPPPYTMYEGVTQLAPASRLALTEGRTPVITRYWHAPFAAPPLKISSKDAEHEVRRLLEAAVARRLEADVPLGAFLSGGIDSTIVVGLMTKLLQRPVKTFSIGFAGDSRFDETEYARVAASYFDSDHTEFTLEPSSFDLVERLVALHDGPFGDASAIPTSVVSMLTRQKVTVALSGDGGDELFCGYPRLLAAEAAERLPASVLRGGRALAKLLPAGSHSRSLRSLALRFVAKAQRPMAQRLLGWSSVFDEPLGDVVTHGMVSSLNPNAIIGWAEASTPPATCSPLARALGFNFETYLPYDLMVKADRSSMAHSLELRSPFLDTALVEFVARLPDHLKRRGLVTKWILKRACRDLLPSEIVQRKKMGFGVPLATWFRGELKEHLYDHLGKNARVYDYVREGYVQKLLRQHHERSKDNGLKLWLLLTFEVWLRSLA